MVLNYDILMVAIGSGIIGIFFHSLLIRIRKCEELVDDFINNFPTPEELAKEIMKVKLPVNELPDDVKNKVKQMMGLMPEEENNTSGEIKPLSTKPNYMG